MCVLFGLLPFVLVSRDWDFFLLRNSHVLWDNDAKLEWNVQIQIYTRYNQQKIGRHTHTNVNSKHKDSTKNWKGMQKNISFSLLVTNLHFKISYLLSFSIFTSHILYLNVYVMYVCDFFIHIIINISVTKSLLKEYFT